MAFASNAFQTEEPAGGNKKQYKQRAAVKSFTYQVEYLGSRMYEDVKWDDREKPQDQQEKVEKVSFQFRILAPKADEALTKLEALEGTAREKAQADFEKNFVEAKGHGLTVWLNAYKPAFVKRPAPGGKETGLYTALKGFLNNGEDLTPEQLKDFVSQMNALENKNNDGTDIVPPSEFVLPQFNIFVQKSAKSGKNYVESVIERVPEEDLLPTYRYPQRPVDPRTANDDPNLHCEQCEAHLNGYELTKGERAGTWVSNTEAAEHSTEKYGKVLCGRCINATKQERAAGGMPF